MAKEILIEILNEHENPLLNRREVEFNVLYEGGVPSLKDVRGKLLSVLNSNEKLTIVDGIKPKFGRNLAKGYVKVYLDENSMKVEPEYRLKKNFEEKKLKKEKPADVKKEPESKEEKVKPEKKP